MTSLSQRAEEAHHLLEIKQFEAARKIYRELVEEDPQNPEHYYNLALTYKEPGEIKDCIKNLIQCRRLCRHFPSAFVRALPLRAMGVAYSVIGDFEKAEKYHKKAIDENPNEVYSWTALAHIKKQKDHKLVEQLTKLLDEAKPREMGLRYLHFAIGKCYDDLGEYDKAFEHFQKGNEYGKEEFDFPLHEEFVEEFETLASPTLGEDIKGNDTDDRFIFVVGMPRSGTTLVDRILSNHPEVASAGEITYLHHINKELNRRSNRVIQLNGTPNPMSVRNVLRFNKDDIKEAAEVYKENVIRLCGDHRYYINKVPNNFVYLPLIKAVLPNSKIIHVQRNAYDTCLSCYFQNFEGNQKWTWDLKDIGRFYRFYRKTMELSQCLDLSIHHIEYERLTDNTEEEVKKLLDFLDLQFNESCLDHQSKTPINTASLWQARQPVYKSSVNRWKNYEKFLDPLFEELGRQA